MSLILAAALPPCLSPKGLFPSRSWLAGIGNRQPAQWTNSHKLVPYPFLADPGKARGCSINTSVINSLNNWLNYPLVKIFYRAVTPKRLKVFVLVIKQTILTFFQRFKKKPWRASKSLYWFNSYNAFVEWVNSAYWWSCIGKGLRLQPAQQACLKKNISLNWPLGQLSSLICLV